VVEKIHQNLHSSRAYLHNRSAEVMFLGTFLCTNSKVQKKARIANSLSRQKKRIIAASGEAVISQFLQPIATRIGDYVSIYNQYGISITLDYTKQVPESSIFF
jgi:hypothetical protein